MGKKLIISELDNKIPIKRNDDVLYNKLDEEVVMLSVENSEYYGFDSIGSRIWELLEEPLNLQEIVDRLTEEYDVSREICTNDTIKFLQKLADKNLILVTN